MSDAWWKTDNLFFGSRLVVINAFSHQFDTNHDIDSFGHLKKKKNLRYSVTQSRLKIYSFNLQLSPSIVYSLAAFIHLRKKIRGLGTGRWINHRAFSFRSWLQLHRRHRGWRKLSVISFRWFVGIYNERWQRSLINQSETLVKRSINNESVNN